MLNFSSISLANTKVRLTLFTLAFALALVLYWPGMNGTPIWDDMTYWFYDSVMDPKFSYFTILKTFAWPISVTAQKFLFNMAGHNWWFYHSVNFVIHSFNSWLVYRFLLLLGIRRWYAFLGFFLFLIHPASVITVAWMVQFKTLVCFGFALGAIIYFIRAKTKRDFALSYLLFLFSILSKSSSLPLPFVLIFFLGKNWKTKKILTVIPFFLISAFGGYQITHSKLARDAITSAAQVAGKGLELSESEKWAQDEAYARGKYGFTMESLLEDPIFNKEFAPPPDEPLAPDGDLGYIQGFDPNGDVKSNAVLEALEPYLVYARLITKTLYYYFWQSYLPVENAPVKGLNPYAPENHDYIHLAFLVLLTIISWKTALLPVLISAHVFLLPYLGIIPAPYMNVTWVSDQHIYLALPCFLLLLLGLMEKAKHKAVVIPFLLLAVYFGFKTREAAGYYKSNIAFYEKSIDHNINNIPLVYNLAAAYLHDDRRQDALTLLAHVISYSDENEHIRDNRYYPFLIHLYTQIIILDDRL